MADEEDYLMLSGIQHFVFCPRQWGLIHLEQQWQDNYRTATGDMLHEKADDPFVQEHRDAKIVTRAMRLVSHKLGIAGQADAIEFHRLSDKHNLANSVTLADLEGHWLPCPVEYKRGRPKADDCDALQLCAQAICLEEMFGIKLEYGYLFYGAIRRREEVRLDEDLRNRVYQVVGQMQRFYRQGITPPAKQGKHCKACSLQEICLPQLQRKAQRVSSYIHDTLLAMEGE